MEAADPSPTGPRTASTDGNQSLAPCRGRALLGRHLRSAYQFLQHSRSVVHKSEGVALGPPAEVGELHALADAHGLPVGEVVLHMGGPSVFGRGALVLGMLAGSGGGAWEFGFEDDSGSVEG